MQNTLLGTICLDKCVDMYGKNFLHESQCVNTLRGMKVEIVRSI